MLIPILCLIGGFLLSLAIGRVCIPRIILISKRRRIFDEPNDRKAHTGAVSRLGGVSFFPALMISFTLFGGLLWRYAGVTIAASEAQEVFFFCAGLIIIYAIGIWDDIAEISWRYKLLFQFLSGGLIILGTPCLIDMQGLFGLHALPCWVACPLTLFLIVSVINAFNLIDGVDGLCSGLCVLIFGTLGVRFVVLGHYFWALLSLCALGIALAFFLYNAFGKRLKIFMGDSGSQTLGYIAAFLCLKLLLLGQAHTPPVEDITPVSMVGLLFVPLFDMLRLFIDRVRTGRSPFAPDKNHVHHKFLHLGYTHLQSTAWILLLQAVYIAGNFSLAPHLDPTLLLVIDLAVALGLILWLEWRRKGAPGG